MLDSLNHLIDPALEILLAAFGQRDFHVVHQGDWCFVIVVVMGNVIEVNQVGFMGAEEILA